MATVNDPNEVRVRQRQILLSIFYYCTILIRSSRGGTRDKLDEGKLPSVSDGTGDFCPKPASKGQNRPLKENFWLRGVWPKGGIKNRFDLWGRDRGQTFDLVHVHEAGDRGRM